MPTKRVKELGDVLLCRVGQEPSVATRRQYFLDDGCQLDIRHQDHVRVMAQIFGRGARFVDGSLRTGRIYTRVNVA